MIVAICSIHILILVVSKLVNVITIYNVHEVRKSSSKFSLDKKVKSFVFVVLHE